MTGQLSKQLQLKPQLIQLHEQCYPYAEAGDWLHLYPSEHFQGEGVYVLQYVRPTSTWQGMRGVRCGPQGHQLGSSARLIAHACSSAARCSATIALRTIHIRWPTVNAPARHR